MTPLDYSIKHFSDLSPLELYQLLRLRISVFIIEQNCPYEECDNKDLNAYHVLGKDEQNVIQACTRLLSAGTSYDNYSSIGRVVTSQQYRNTGEGRRLMSYSLQKMSELYPHNDIKISSQTYISKFYASLGFVATEEEYLEDDIPHIAMIKSKK
ncbi:MAG: hypothetical protein RLZZ546_2661 [Bacteroidota bacterium]